MKNSTDSVYIDNLFISIVGFCQRYTNPMVSAFKKILELNSFEAFLVQLAFYGGYFTMALPAAMFANRYTN